MPTNYPVFISYRREDSPGHAGRMFDRLRNRFGPEGVFWDIEIEPGTDFVQAIEDAVGSCEVLVAVIGRFWLNAKDTDGNRRLDNPDDFVRLEIETALRRNVLVIPVLVFEAKMPRPSDLPDGLLRKLARRNALEISDRRFDEDVERLVRMLEKVLTGAEARASLPEAYQHLNVRTESVPLSVVPKTIVIPSLPETVESLVEHNVSEKPGTRDGLYYSKDHEWIKVEGNIGVVGISDYAQNALSDIVYIELPRPGDVYAVNEAFGSVESVKAVSELFSPVSGEIIGINDTLTDEPERVNNDALGNGWMIRIRMSDPSEVDKLLTDTQYEDFIKTESE